MYFIDSDEYLHSYAFAQFYILSAVRHHASGNDFFLPNICTALYTRVLYLFSYFTFPCASAASNHKSQANPRVFVVYALSFQGTSLPSVASYISLALCIPICTRRSISTAFVFSPRVERTVRERTSVSFHNTKLVSRNVLLLQFVVFGHVCQICPSSLSFRCSRYHRRWDVNAILCIYEATTIRNAAAILK